MLTQSHRGVGPGGGIFWPPAESCEYTRRACLLWEESSCTRTKRAPRGQLLTPSTCRKKEKVKPSVQSWNYLKRNRRPPARGFVILRSSTPLNPKTGFMTYNVCDGPFNSSSILLYNITVVMQLAVTPLQPQHTHTRLFSIHQLHCTFTSGFAFIINVVHVRHALKFQVS